MGRAAGLAAGLAVVAAVAAAVVVARVRPHPLRPAPGAWAGRVAIVTGATAGVGKATARRLALGGFKVVIACRSPEKAAVVADDINRELKSSGGDGIGGGGSVVSMPLDLASRRSIRAFAAAFIATGMRLDALVCNAGLAGTGSEHLTTRDGFDLAFGTNYLGHFMLLRLLQPALAATGTAARPARVVLLSSVTHRAGGATADFELAYNDAEHSLYADSKLAMNVLAEVLERRIAADELPPTVRYFAVNPGGVNSDVWRFLDGSTLEVPIRALFAVVLLDNDQGAETSVVAATDPALLDRPKGGWPGGSMSPYLAPYWVPRGLLTLGLTGTWVATAFEGAAPFAGAQVVAPHPVALDRTVGERLWAVSEKFIEEGGRA